MVMAGRVLILYCKDAERKSTVWAVAEAHLQRNCALHVKKEVSSLFFHSPHGIDHAFLCFLTDSVTSIL